MLIYSIWIYFGWVDQPSSKLSPKSIDINWFDDPGSAFSQPQDARPHAAARFRWRAPGPQLCVARGAAGTAQRIQRGTGTAGVSALEEPRRWGIKMDEVLHLVIPTYTNQLFHTIPCLCHFNLCLIYFTFFLSLNDLNASRLRVPLSLLIIVLFLLYLWSLLCSWSNLFLYCY